MSKAKGYPSMQQFNIQNARRNLTKNPEKCWWGHQPYHNNPTQKQNKNG